MRGAGLGFWVLGVGLLAGCAGPKTLMLELTEFEPNIGGERRELFVISVPLPDHGRAPIREEGGGAGYRGWARTEPIGEWRVVEVELEKVEGGERRFALRTELLLELGTPKSLGEFRTAAGSDVEWTAVVRLIPSPP